MRKLGGILLELPRAESNVKFGEFNKIGQTWTGSAKKKTKEEISYRDLRPDNVDEIVKRR